MHEHLYFSMKETHSISRRSLVRNSVLMMLAGFVPKSGFSHTGGEEKHSSMLSPGLPHDRYPAIPLSVASEVVGVAHFNLERLKELVDPRPELAKATWDWGFGDWESALGAASHVGRRPIAEFLIANGARIDIFAAAMLGMTDVVKAFVAAQPGVQRILGPHGITLLDHAKAGGPQAAATVQYLEQLGDAGQRPATVPFPEDRVNLLTGRYRIDGESREIEIKVSRNGILQIECPGRDGFRSPRNLFHKGADTFFPSGVPSIGFRFDFASGSKSTAATTITILDPSGAASGIARRS